MSVIWPQNLIDAVARRRAVILIGSGVSANATNAGGSRPPTWWGFLNTACKKLGRRIRYIESALKEYNYLAVCDYLRTEHGSAWNELIRDVFVAPKYKAGEIHRLIFDLDCSIVVSLNFDKIYEMYAIQASYGTVVIKNYYDDDIRQAVVGSDMYIIKPHGTVDSISKIIFTLDDYSMSRTKYAPFYELMTSLIHTHTFLCIGCGLSDPDMKLIFEDYRYKFNESPHFITLSLPISDAECRLIQKTRGLNTIKYNRKDTTRN
jgi:SIR2-like domain